MDIKIGHGLTEAQRKKSGGLIKDFKKVFRKEPGRCQLYEHSRQLKDLETFVQRIYPSPMHYREAVDIERRKMLGNDVLETVST